MHKITASASSDQMMPMTKQNGPGDFCKSSGPFCLQPCLSPTGKNLLLFNIFSTSYRLSILCPKYRSTLPKVLEYSAQSTGVLCPKYRSTLPEVPEYSARSTQGEISLGSGSVLSIQQHQQLQCQQQRHTVAESQMTCLVVEHVHR